MILWTRAFQDELGSPQTTPSFALTGRWLPDRSGCGIKKKRQLLWLLAVNRRKTQFVCLGSIRHPRSESPATPSRVRSSVRERYFTLTKYDVW